MKVVDGKIVFVCNICNLTNTNADLIQKHETECHVLESKHSNLLICYTWSDNVRFRWFWCN